MDQGRALLGASEGLSDLDEGEAAGGIPWRQLRVVEQPALVDRLTTATLGGTQPGPDVQNLGSVAGASRREIRKGSGSARPQPM